MAVKTRRIIRVEEIKNMEVIARAKRMIKEVSQRAFIHLFQLSKKELREVYPILALLKRLGLKERTTLLKYLNGKARNAVYACINNALHNVNVNGPAFRKKMKGDKASLRYLNNTKLTPETRRRRMIQSGGALGAVLATVLPLLASFLFNNK
jgi:hypothetical protein